MRLRNSPAELNRFGRALVPRPGSAELRIRIRGGDLFDEETAEYGWLSYRYRIC
jgi:hypothetical protein